MANSTRHRGGKNQTAMLLQEIHGVIMESTNITTRPQLTNPSWCKSWTTMVHIMEKLDDHGAHN